MKFWWPPEGCDPQWHEVWSQNKNQIVGVRVSVNAYKETLNGKLVNFSQILQRKYCRDRSVASRINTARTHVKQLLQWNSQNQIRSVLFAEIKLAYICLWLSQLTSKGWGFFVYESLTQHANAKIPKNLWFTTADGSCPQVKINRTKPPHSFTCMSTRNEEEHPSSAEPCILRMSRCDCYREDLSQKFSS